MSRPLPRLAAGLLLVVAGCADPPVPAGPPPSSGRGAGLPAEDYSDPPAPAGALRYLALGDSYTIGEGVPAADRWPVQLAGLLRKDGANLADPTIIARTGWTCAELSAAMDRADPKGPYPLVSLLIGVNDQYRGKAADAYREPFARLLKRAAGLAGGKADRVIVLSIPDWGVTPFAAGRDRAAIAAALDRFNAVNKEEAEKAGARYVEVTAGSRRAADKPELLAADKLHPSGAMYAEWAAAALPAAKAALGEGKK